jgi:hypothetical protein
MDETRKLQRVRSANYVAEGACRDRLKIYVEPKVITRGGYTWQEIDPRDAAAVRQARAGQIGQQARAAEILKDAREKAATALWEEAKLRRKTAAVLQQPGWQRDGACLRNGAWLRDAAELLGPFPPVEPRKRRRRRRHRRHHPASS